MNEKDRLEGIDGWLILVAIGIIIAPFRIAYMMYQTYPDVFEPTVWDALTTPGSAAYHPMWATIIYTEVLINVAFIIAWIVVAFKLFGKSSTFPKWFILAAVLSVVYMLLDILVVRLMLPNEPALDPATAKALAQTVAYAAIWIPYILVSKRVKATFGGGSQELSPGATKRAEAVKSIRDVLIACVLGAASGLIAAGLGQPKLGIFLGLIVVTGYIVNSRS